MTDQDAIIEPASTTVERGGSKAGWFAVGALTASLVFGLFLFANDYLCGFRDARRSRAGDDHRSSVRPEPPKKPA